MLKKGLLLLLISILSAGMVMAYAPSKAASVKSRPMTPEKIIGPNSPLPAPDGMGPGAYPPLNTDDPIGDLFQFGTTWYDIQHNGTCGRQLMVDNEGYVHLAWMNGLNNGASQRHIYYQLMDPMENLMFTGTVAGIQVDQASRGGYTVMELSDDNRGMPCFHQVLGSNANAHTALAFDYFPRVGAFQANDLPWVYEGATDVEVIWPRMDKDIQGRFHIVSTENPASGVAGDPQRIYYARVAFDPFTYQFTYETPSQIEITWTETISADIACSPVSNKAALAWMEFNATQPDTTQYDNDVMLVISEDGETWDFENPINVTQWIPPDEHYLPDTVLADRDTLRAYTDMAVIIDARDVVHVFFTAIGFYALEGTLTWGNCFIMHWDNLEEVFSVVANGWYDNGYYDPGAWNRYVQRPSPAIDFETGEMYCMYQRYYAPYDTTLEEMPWWYLYGDTAIDWSEAGWPCGEVWMTKSTDGGYSWSEGIDITNTHASNPPAGQCPSELTPSMAPQIFNDYAHVFYIDDKDAGAIVQDEGTWTLNNAVYHRVPLEAIPESPRFPVYPMHVDSTGMPADTFNWNYNYVADIQYNLPSEFSLQQNFPNPFNPETCIQFSIKTPGYASLKVFNINGELVSTVFAGQRSAGEYKSYFDASSLSSGVYFYTLKVNGMEQTKKMVLMK